MIHADGGDNVMNYGAIPDTPQHWLIYIRIEELSDVNILYQLYYDSPNTSVVNIFQARKTVEEMAKELALDMDGDIDGFPLSSNHLSNSVDIISSSFPGFSVDISNISYSLSSVSVVGKGKRMAEEMMIVSSKCTKIDVEETVVSEEKKIGDGGQ